MMKRVAICFVVLCVAVMVTGCGSETDKAGSGKADQEPEGAKHAHGEEAAHDGILIELGGAYHAELVSDHDSQTVTIHFEDCESTEPKVVVATAVTLSVFNDGDYVDFVFSAGSEPGTVTLVDDGLCDLLEHEKDIKSRLKATIAGEELVASYEHEAH